MVTETDKVQIFGLKTEIDTTPRFLRLDFVLRIDQQALGSNQEQFDGYRYQNKDARPGSNRTRQHYRTRGNNEDFFDDYETDSYFNDFDDNRQPDAFMDRLLRVLGKKKNHQTNKLGVPEYNGKGHADKFVDWLNRVDTVFDRKKIPEHRRVEG